MHFLMVFSMLLVIILVSISSAEEDVHFAWPPRLDSDSCRAEDCSDRNGITLKLIYISRNAILEICNFGE